MAEATINVIIAGRTYPVSVPEGEVENVKKAAARVTDLLGDLETKYQVRDRQDLLAMCALELASNSLKFTVTNTSLENHLGQLQALETMVDKQLV